jgi:hypothetical protein
LKRDREIKVKEGRPPQKKVKKKILWRNNCDRAVEPAATELAVVTGIADTTHTFIDTDTLHRHKMVTVQ